MGKRSLVLEEAVMGLGFVVTLIVFASVCTFMGGRLMLLSRSGHRLPALSIGLAFIFSGCLGFPLLSVASAFPEALGSMLGAAQLSGFAALNLGALALWTFTWRTFRPSSTWASILVAAAAILLLGIFVLKVTTTEATSGLEFNAAFWVGFSVRALGPLWAAVESLRYYSLMRRRLKIGLADPVVTNRFLLWGISSLGTVSMSLTTAVVILAGSSLSLGFVELLRVFGMIVGLSSGISMWLAFFPPAFYRKIFESDSLDGMDGEVA